MKRLKKILLLGIFILCFAGLCACDITSSKQDVQKPDASSYTVIFEQSGVKDVVKTVEKGKALTDIPTPKAKTGYTVAWDTSDFSSITKNMTVKAIETPKKYTIVFDENGGEELAADTLTVEYDSLYLLPKPTHLDGLFFKGWYVGETNVETSGIWRTDKELTVKAVWQCRLTFQEKGLNDKVFYVDYGKSFTDIPQIESVPVGVNCYWSVLDFSNVTENMTVSVISEAKEFSICLDWNNGTGKTKTVTVKYGENYSLDTPSFLGHTFDCWTYNGEEIPLSGIWNLGGENIVLKARWINNADTGDWTPLS